MKVFSPIKLSVNSCSYSSWDEKVKVLLPNVFISSILLWLMMQCLFICLLDDLMLGFCSSNSTREAGGFELASTIPLVLQANRLTKCSSHPNGVRDRSPNFVIFVV